LLTCHRACMHISKFSLGSFSMPRGGHARAIIPAHIHPMARPGNSRVGIDIAATKRTSIFWTGAMGETAAAAALVMSVALRWRAGGRAWRGGGPGRGEVDEERGREAGSLQVATWGARDAGCCESCGRIRHQVQSVYLATRQAPPGGTHRAHTGEVCCAALFGAGHGGRRSKIEGSPAPPSIAAAGRGG